MGFYFKKNYSPRQQLPQITEEMAKNLLDKLFNVEFSDSPSQPTEVFSKTHDDAASACSHIGEYIYDLMFEQNFSTIDVTIKKDDDNKLVFNLNKTEL